MIRFVTITALLSLLVLVLYLPSVNPPERFLAQIQAEYQAMRRFWGEVHALRILERALSLQDSVREVTPVPSAANAPSIGNANGAAAQELALVNQRLFNSSYFRAIDALVLLAVFRLFTMVEWLPWLLAIAVAAVADGAIERVIKAREFRQHDPEMFAVHVCLAIVMACTAVVGFVIPVTLHPLVMPLVSVAVIVLLGRAVAQFHRRA